MSSLRSPRPLPSLAARNAARAADPATTLASSEAIAARLDELERKSERLRALYESFFLGTERRPPNVPRREMNRLMLELQQVTINNAGLRFRFQSLMQRWTLMTTYWNRTLREIECGTYRRDLEKVYRRLARRGEPLTENEAIALGIPAARARTFVAQQNRRWGGPTDNTADASGVASRTRTDRSAPGMLPDEGVDLAALYQSYLDAHASLGLRDPPLDVARLRTAVARQVAALREAHPSRRFRLVAVAEEGRIRLRARPV